MHTHKSLPQRLLSSPQHQVNPKIPEPGSHVQDKTCIYNKPDWLLQQFDEWTTSGYHQETPACAKHSWQISFQSEEIWSHTSCTRYASLVPSQILDSIQFKTLLAVFKGLHGKAPTYIQEMITLSKSKRYSIRSNEESALNVPKSEDKTFGKRAFWPEIAWQRKLG